MVRAYPRPALWCVATALASLLATALGCGGPEEMAEEPVIRPVRFVVVTASDEARERRFAGEARSGRESELSFRVAGTVESIGVAVGDRVQAGGGIARLDPTDYRLQMREAEAAAAQAEAAARKAEGDYERVRGLYENNNASKSDLDAARAGAESSQAQLAAARQRAERSRRQVGYTRLTAPVAGAIAAVEVEEGENVGAGQTVAVLASGRLAEVEVAVPGALISEIEEGGAATVAFEDLQGAIYLARVTEVGVVASRSGTFSVTVRLDREAEEVRSGMAASVTFRFESTNSGRIYLPSVAVGEDTEGRFVWVLDGEGETAVTQRRPVEVGELTPEGLEVLAGVADGERVVTAGVRRIHEGQTVRVAAMERDG